MTNPLEFTAHVVNCYMENDVITIGIGDDDIAPSNFVIISRLDEEIDVQRPVEENIGIQTNCSKFESTAAITEIILEENRLQISIKSEKIQEIGSSEIKIILNAKKFEISELARYLHLIFDDANLEFAIHI